jgi:hypothetical protein
MRSRKFADCRWILEWTDRVDTARAWRVPIGDIEANDYNSRTRNPNGADDLAHTGGPPDSSPELVNTDARSSD